MSGVRSNRSLAARRGHPYDKGRGFAAQALWVAVSTLIFTQVWCPNRLRCAILRWFGAEIGDGRADQASSDRPMAMEAFDRRQFVDRHRCGVVQHRQHRHRIRRVPFLSTSYLCTGSHDRRSPTFEFDNGPIVIEDGVWLCARSTVLRGVTIGANSVVGATSLVTNDVPPELDRSATSSKHRHDLMRILQVRDAPQSRRGLRGPRPRGAQSERGTDRPGPRRDGRGRHPRLSGRADRAGRGAGPVVRRSNIGSGNRFRRHGRTGTGQVVPRQRAEFRCRAHPSRPRTCRSAGGGGRAATRRSRTCCRPTAWLCRHAIPLPHRWTRSGRGRCCATPEAVFYLTPQEREQLGDVAGPQLATRAARQRCARSTQPLWRSPRTAGGALRRPHASP